MKQKLCIADGGSQQYIYGDHRSSLRVPLGKFCIILSDQTGVLKKKKRKRKFGAGDVGEGEGHFEFFRHAPPVHRNKHGGAHRPFGPLMSLISVIFSAGGFLRIT